MANFPIFHGITLAANSAIENLHVEILTSDPVPVAAGRVWYNSTDKVFRQSTLDGSGGVIVRTFATAEDLAAEISDLQGQIGTLSSLQTTAKGDLVSAINEVNSSVNALGSAFNYVSTVAGGADAGNATDLDLLAEKDAGDYYKVSTAGWFKIGAAGTPFYANSNDGLVWNLAASVDIIDNTNSELSSANADFITVAGDTDNGFTVDVAQAFKDRMTTAEGDIDQLQSDVGTLSSLTTTAQGNLVAAINELDSDLGTVESQVNGKIGDLTTLTTDAKSTLVAALNEVDSNADTNAANLAQEITDRATADTAIRTDIETALNGKRFTFQSETAATTHTVAHNLNSAFVDFTVLVERPDGKFRNDVVSVEEFDNNTLKVYLSTAQNIKIAVTAMSAYDITP